MLDVFILIWMVRNVKLFSFVFRFSMYLESHIWVKQNFYINQEGMLEKVSQQICDMTSMKGRHAFPDGEKAYTMKFQEEMGLNLI